MKLLAGMLTIAACSALAFGQPKQTMEPAAAAQEKAAPEKRPCPMMERGMAQHMPEMMPGCMGPEHMRGRCIGEGMPQNSECCPGMTKHHREHFFLCNACAGLVLLSLLALAILNILLTIIVSTDMTRAGRFNGLWIPVMLIAGIPGSAIYALFRLGDYVKEKQKA